MAIKLKAKAPVESPSAGSSIVLSHKGTLVSESDKSEIVTGAEPHKDPVQSIARVGVSITNTVNQGNYNSVKLGVWIDLPSDVGNLEASYKFASEWVVGKMTELTTELSEAE